MQPEYEYLSQVGSSLAATEVLVQNMKEMGERKCGPNSLNVDDFDYCCSLNAFNIFCCSLEEDFAAKSFKSLASTLL